MGSQPAKLEQMGGWRREHFSKVYNFFFVPLIYNRLLPISTVRMVQFHK